MKNSFKQFLKDFLPPYLLRVFCSNCHNVRFKGNFKTWNDALSHSSGYDAENIIEKVKTASIKVKNGDAIYERDSVLFDNIQYSWPLLSALLWIAVLSDNKLNILDFGGSLGSSYYQNRSLLSALDKLKWNVVEQPAFVKTGKEFFQDEVLFFYESIEACLAENKPDLLLLSSVLPYLEAPHDLLNEVVNRQFPFVIIDRTPIIDGLDDRLTVQKVPPSIYEASYPAWFFNREKLLSHFSGPYDLVAEFDALAGEIYLGATVAKDKGFIFRLRSDPR